MHTQPEGKSPHLNIRIKAPQRSLIEQAAQASDKTVSDFVRDAALREARNALLDRNPIVLSKEEWDRFTAALDEPPKLNPRLRDLMARTPVWEK